MTPDDLKAGNPDLNDEHIQYGIRRAGEIFKAHEDAQSNGLVNFRKQFPGVLHLADFQLAAIVADAYREGGNVKGADVAELRAALKGIFEHFAMVHKYWGENDNTKAADVALRQAEVLLAKDVK